MASQIGAMNLDLGTEYQRKLPDNFSEDSPNKFMYLILTNFALEGKSEDGKPNGKFIMNKDLTNQAGKMIVEKYKKLEAKPLDAYMK